HSAQLCRAREPAPMFGAWRSALHLPEARRAARGDRMEATEGQRQDDWLAPYTGPCVCVAHLVSDRYGDLGRCAGRYEDAGGIRTELTFAELRERSARFAGALQALGVGPGDRVATLL